MTLILNDEKTFGFGFFVRHQVRLKETRLLPSMSFREAFPVKSIVKVLRARMPIWCSARNRDAPGGVYCAFNLVVWVYFGVCL